MSQGQFHLCDLRFCGSSLVLFLSVVKLVIEVIELNGAFYENFKSVKGTIKGLLTVYNI